MDTFYELNDVKIASPCPASWAAMHGDDRVRFCDACSKRVYDLSGLTAAEAGSLIEEAEGRLCVRLYRRRDGTVLTADCPVGLRYAVRRRLLRLATAGVVSIAFLRSGVWLYANGKGLPPVSPPPVGPGVTIADWADWAASTLGLRTPRRGVVMGMIQVCPPPPAAPGTAAPTSIPPSGPIQEGPDEDGAS